MDIPVYISMTSMFRRQGRLFECLKNILKQSYKPTKIFIYLSEDASFFDDGISASFFFLAVSTTSFFFIRVSRGLVLHTP